MTIQISRHTRFTSYKSYNKFIEREISRLEDIRESGLKIIQVDRKCEAG